MQSIRTFPCEAVVLMSFKPQHNKVISTKTLGDITYFRLVYDTTKFKEAACQGIDTEIFYPESNDLELEQWQVIRRICSTCPIREMCLEWALCHEREGIWAGTRPHDRRKLRHRLRLGVTDTALATRHST